MKIRMSLVCVVAVALLLLISGPAVEAEQESLVRSKVLEAARSISRKDYPNADEVIVEDIIKVRYESDGTAKESDESYIKILTEKGKRENRTLNIRFSLPYEKAGVGLLEIIKPDGTAVEIDASRYSRVAIDPTQMQANIYDPNDKILNVSIPGLEVGDVLHVITNTEIVKPRVVGTWSDYQVFEYYNPIRHLVYEVDAPQELPLESIALKNRVRRTVSKKKYERNGRIFYRWELRDVPRMYQEPEMPALHTQVQRLLVSTIPDWEYISRWYWKLSEPHLAAVTPEMEEKVSELVSGIDDSRKKIETIFRWVSQEVRYLGITVEKEAPGYEPHDVSMTFENRHGVCRDKAALLVAMLRLAGLRAYPVLMYVGPKKDQEVPQPFFNHAISAVEVEDKSYVLMDATDESTKELLPAYLSDKSYLVARPEGDTLRTSAITSPLVNILDVVSQGVVERNGDLVMTSELRFYGINDNAYRGYLASLSAVQRRQYLEYLVKQTIPGAVLRNFEVLPENLLDTSVPLTLRLEFDAQRVPVESGREILVPMPFFGRKVGMVKHLFERAGLFERKYPFKTDFTAGVREKFELRIDHAFGEPAELPRFTPIDDETISWNQSLSFDERVLKGENSFLVKVVEFSPKQYAQLKESLGAIEVSAKKLPIFLRKKAGDSLSEEKEADARILSKKVYWNVKNEHEWTVTVHKMMKILTYKGKKEFSEFEREFNPVWEEINLLEAAVINGGRRKEVAKEEINMMDAGWVGSAPRYPPAKKLVVSFPGVEKGSIIEIAYERKKKDRPFFSLQYEFQEHVPVDSVELKVSVPSSLHLQIVQDDNGILVPDERSTETVLKRSKRKRAGRIDYIWKAKNLPALAQESAAPPLFTFSPAVRISAGKWSEFSAQTAKAVTRALDGKEGVLEQVQSITKGASLRAEKIEAIRDFVGENIRSAGPRAGELPLSLISTPQRTLSDGYGSMFDRAVLLYSMLDALKLEPRLVYVNCSVLDPKVQEFQGAYPFFYDFKDVLVRVNDGSQEVYLNDTDQYAELGSTWREGCQELAFDTGELSQVFVAPDKEARTDFFYRIRLKSDGDARIESGRTTYGTSYGKRRKDFAEMPPEERKRFFEELVAKVSQTARPKGKLSTFYDSYPGREQFTVEVEQFAVREGDYLYFEIPKTLAGVLRASLDSRETPMYKHGFTRMKVVVEVILPKRYSKVVVAPEPEEWFLPRGAKVSVSVQKPGSAKEKMLRIEYAIDAAPFVVQPEFYGELRRINQQLSHLRSRLVVLGR